MFHMKHKEEEKLKTSKIQAMDRLKLLKIVDYDNKLFPLKSTQYHINLMNFLINANRGVVTAFRGFAKSTTANGHYIPTEALTSPSNRVFLIISNSNQKSKDWVASIGNVLERFMNAGFDGRKGDYWNQNGIQFINENGKKISIAAMSPQKDIRGTNKDFERPTDIICDDLESASPNALINAMTIRGREKMDNYFFADLLPSLSTNARLIVIGTILHNESLISKLLRDDSFEKFVLPAIINGESAWKSKFPLTEKDKNVLCETFPDRKDFESLEVIRERLRSIGQIDIFHREYLCEASSEESRFFKQEMFKYHNGIVYGMEIDYIEVKDGLNSRKIPIKSPKYIIIDGERISLDRSDFRKFLCIDNASDGGDSHAMIVAGNFRGRIYVLDIAGGIKYSPFDKACDLLRLTLEWKCDYGSEKGGMQNDYLYINKALIAEYREHYSKRGFYPNGLELKTHGRAKNVRIAQLQIPMLEGKIFFNPQCPMNAYLEQQLLDFVIDAENRDDYPDALAYFLQVFGFIDFKQDKPKGKMIGVNFLFE